MPARLVIESDIDKSRQEISFDKPRITIGRKPGNDLHFNRPEISGTHAAFLLENDSHYVSDLGSTNGTLLNGAPLVAKEKYPLQNDDVVTITPYRITFMAEIGATMMEAVSPQIDALRRGGSGTQPDMNAKISTGTAEHEKSGQPNAKAAAAPPPPKQSAPPPVIAEPESEPEPPPPPPKPKPKPAPKPAPPPAAAAEGAADAVEEKGPGGFGEYIWLAVGGIFFILAVGLLILLFAF